MRFIRRRKAAAIESARDIIGPQDWKDYGNFKHRSGWPVIVEALRDRLGKKPACFEDFIESVFAWAPRQGFHFAEIPWAGIAHNPRGDHPLVHALPIDPIHWVRLQKWRAAAPMQKKMICMSKHQADQYREHYLILAPCEVLYHPTTYDHPEFQFDRWLEDTPLAQVGEWLRNTELMHMISTGMPQTIVRRNTFFAEHTRKWLMRKGHLSKKKNPAVKEVSDLSNEEYDDLLASHVLVTEVFDASANNVVLESIVRGTPHLINRHPAVVEYLGEEYPGYWQSRRDIGPMARDVKRVRDCHHYLKGWRNQKRFTIEHFVDQVEEIVKTCSS